MMTLNEKAAFILALYKTASEQRKGDNTSINALFFTINDQNKVFESNLSTSAVFNDTNYIICCLRSHYLSYGWQNHNQVFVILNRECDPINQIPGNNWVIDRIAFDQCRDPGMPLPSITFSRNSNPDQQITLRFSQARRFQQVWDFFLQIDRTCNTIAEASIYHKYYEEKSESNDLNKSLEEIKAELNSKNNIIDQYQQLLKKIQNLIDNSNCTG